MASEKPQEKCGILGIYGAPGAARDAYFGLLALQHRGQESSGIASSNSQEIKIKKDMGLVFQVYDEEDMDFLVGDMAIGHNRYSTSQGSKKAHIQPVSLNENLVLSHNGNLPTTKKIEDFLFEEGLSINNLNDSEQMYQAINFYLLKGATLADAVESAYPLFEGAFACVAMTKKELVAFQDPFAIKPLSIGKFRDGHVVASETCALDTIGASFIREVEPGKLISFKQGGFSEHQIIKGSLKRDLFEFVYFSRHDSYMMGQTVYEVRKNFGKNLARECPVNADIVVPIPDSAIPTAIGFAEESKIFFEEAIAKNRYIFRTFIHPDPALRLRGVRLKLNTIQPLVEGRRVVLVDDSIVRGTTSPQQVKMLKRAGAKEVHLMIGSPPYKYPHLYGIDTRSTGELIAATKSVEEIREQTGADSLHYLSYEGMIKATGIDEDKFTTSCFTGEYPTRI